MQEEPRRPGGGSVSISALARFVSKLAT